MNTLGAIIIFTIGAICGICWREIYEKFIKAYGKIKR